MMFEDILCFFQQGEKAVFEEYLNSLRIRFAFYWSVCRGCQDLDILIEARTGSEVVKLPIDDWSAVSALEDTETTAALYLKTKDADACDALLADVDAALHVVAQVQSHSMMEFLSMSNL